MATSAIDFSDLGGKPVQQAQAGIDFSDLGGKQVSPASASPTGSIRAADQPTGWRDRAAKWLDNATYDVQHGTQIPGLGSLLHSMGAQGTSSGQGEAVGDFMASGPLGAMRAAKGAAEVTQSGKTWQGNQRHRRRSIAGCYHPERLRRT